MIPRTNILINTQGAAVTGSLNGQWYQVPADGRFQIPILISFKTGTGTVVVEGRHTPSDDPAQIASVSADAASNATKWSQIRVRITGATALEVVVSLDIPCKQV